jgi:predicted CXXCH cytochrome family protein
MPRSTTDRRTNTACALWCAALTGATLLLVAGMSGRSLPTEASAVAVEFTAEEPTGAVVSSCDACHRMDPAMSHPVGVRPSMATPAGLPLDHGVMTCSTCHTPSAEHVAGRARAGDRVGVRVEGAGLCMACHTAGEVDSKSVHARHLGKAHLRTGKAPATGAHAGVDFESRSCMECHDGAMAKDAGFHAPKGGPHGMDSDHPIGVSMRQGIAGRNGDFRLASERTLDPRIRLFYGAVGCGSCHSAYSKEPAQLVMSNRRSALCLSCHTQ